jgi:hypothetical protein
MMEVLTVKKAILLAVAAAVVAGYGLPSRTDAASGSEGFDELAKEKGLFKTTLIRPDADFAKYSKVYPRDVLLQFRNSGPEQEESIPGSMIRRRRGGNDVPKGQDLATLRRIINDAVEDELESSEGFEVVHDVGSETLMLRSAVVDIVTDAASQAAKPEEKRRPCMVRGEVVFDLIDAETGVIQARLVERRKSPRGKASEAPAGADVLWVNVNNWAEAAAADLRRELERLRNEDLDTEAGTGA